MIHNDEGLTITYNRFHSPDEHDPGILKLRELHVAMDRAVLDAYGWQDIPNDRGFLLDYEIDEEEWGEKKKPWRYRWPDEICDEVLGAFSISTLNALRRRPDPGPPRSRRKARRPQRSAPPRFRTQRICSHDNVSSTFACRRLLSAGIQVATETAPIDDADAEFDYSTPPF